MNERNSHSWFEESIATYISDGLEGEEKAQFQSHAAQCADCKMKLDEATEDDESLLALFRDLRPTAGFEDRVIGRLRFEPRGNFALPMMIRLHPRVAHTLGAAAAAVVLAGIGYGGLTFFQSRQQSLARNGAASDLRQLGQALPPNNTYANPYPDTRALGNFKMIDGITPTFAAGADINTSPAKNGQNVFGGGGSGGGMVNRNPIATPALVTQSLAGLPPAHEPEPELVPPTPQEMPSQTATIQQGVSMPVIDESKDNARDGSNQPTEAPAVSVDSALKIIRHGEMSFEVDHFDSAFGKISKIAAEEGGFIAGTNSEKLDNGKTRGTVTVRVPPDHLDTLTMKLRALGDLKQQQIEADDITKQYTDLQSELRAAQAMEDRLLDLIKNGKGQVKDLLAAEKELDVWREKIEQITGEINYDNNQISLSTLRIELTEKGIDRPASANERETVGMSLETEDVAHARAEALQILHDAKATILQADLTQLDQGRLTATITANVSPEAGDALLDRIEHLGGVTHLEILRRQSNDDGDEAANGVEVRRADMRLSILLTSSASLNPRQTISRVLAAPDVSDAYARILAAAHQSGATVAGARLDESTPSDASGQLDLIVPQKAMQAIDKAITDAKAATASKNVSWSADLNSTTQDKVELQLTVENLDQLPPRQTTAMSIEVSDPAKASQDFQSAVLGAGGRIIDRNMTRDDRYEAHLVVDLPLSKGPEFIERARAAGAVTNIVQTDNSSVPQADFASERLDMAFVGPGAIVGESTGLLTSLKSGLSMSVSGLFYSFELVVIGLCLVLPWAVIVWGGWKVFRHIRRKPGG